MRLGRLWTFVWLGVAALTLARAGAAAAEEKPIRIGVLYDLSGPFAAAGSVAQSIGTQIAFDLINERGGILGKYKVEAVKADTQSKVDVAINEAERLLSQEKVEILIGVYSSAQAVPLAAKVDEQKKILWINSAVATAVLKDRNLHYVFRAQTHTDQYGSIGIGFLAENAKAKLGLDPNALKLAIIHEDGPYGSGVGAADARNAKEKGMSVALDESYSSSAPDLSSLVTKLKRAQADVILHTGYNPDITLFLRQARDAGLRMKMLIGNGAGYSELDKLRASFGDDIDNFCNIDPVPAQLLDAGKLAPGLGDLIATLVKRYKEKTGGQEAPSHLSIGFNQTWILLDKLLPIAIEKYGGTDPEAIRKAAADLDIPAGGTIQGYGVKFAPPGSPMAGQNERATPVVMQNHQGHLTVVYPTAIKTQDAVLPLPASSPYAAR